MTTVSCCNEQFLACGTCSYELPRGKSCRGCRYVHDATECRPCPSAVDILDHSVALLKEMYMQPSRRNKAVGSKTVGR